MDFKIYRMQGNCFALIDTVDADCRYRYCSHSLLFYFPLKLIVYILYLPNKCSCCPLAVSEQVYNVHAHCACCPPPLSPQCPREKGNSCGPGVHAPTLSALLLTPWGGSLRQNSAKAFFITCFLLVECNVSFRERQRIVGAIQVLSILHSFPVLSFCCNKKKVLKFFGNFLLGNLCKIYQVLVQVVKVPVPKGNLRVTKLFYLLRFFDNFFLG